MKVSRRSAPAAVLPSGFASPARLPGPGSTAEPVAKAAGMGVRFGLGLVLAVAGKVLGTWLYGLPVLSLLGFTSVVFVVCATLFGWAGLAAATLVQAAVLAWRNDLLTPYPLGTLAGYAAAGALAWATFRHVPGLGRGFPSGKSLRWFAAAGAAGGVLSSTVISVVARETDLWAAVAVWSRSTVVSVWVFAPAVLAIVEAFGRRWLAVVPDEVVTAPRHEVVVSREARADGELPVLEVGTRPMRPWRLAVVALGAIVVVSLGKAAFSGGWGAGLAWWNLLYLPPIYLLAQRLLLPGGLVAAAAAGLGSLAADSWLAPAARISNEVAVGTYAQLLLFWAVAVLVGAGASREAALVDSLAESHERIRQDLQRVVRALTGALEAKDEYTEGHLQRVNAYASEVGARLGLAPRELELLQIAGTLHDIGKIGIPEAILNKPGPLDEEERALMQRHPEIGARLLARLDGLRDAAPLVLHHQERWDGDRGGRFPGYPAGLRGEEIPLGARIIAVVDAFDAMTTSRPYRPALDIEEARRRLVVERGRQFDPAVVDRFLQILDERPWS